MTKKVTNKGAQLAKQIARDNRKSANPKSQRGNITKKLVTKAEAIEQATIKRAGVQGANKAKATATATAIKVAQRTKVGKMVLGAVATAAALGVGTKVIEDSKPQKHMGSSGPINPRGGAKPKASPASAVTKKLGSERRGGAPMGGIQPKATNKTQSVNVAAPAPAPKPAPAPAPLKQTSDFFSGYVAEGKPDAPVPKKSGKKDIQIGNIAGRKEGKWHLGKKVGKG